MEDNNQNQRPIATSSSLRKIGGAFFLVATVVPLFDEKNRDSALKWFAFAGGTMLVLSLFVDE